MHLLENAYLKITTFCRKVSRTSYRTATTYYRACCSRYTCSSNCQGEIITLKYMYIALLDHEVIDVIIIYTGCKANWIRAWHCAGFVWSDIALTQSACPCICTHACNQWHVRTYIMKWGVLGCQLDITPPMHALPSQKQFQAILLSLHV